MIFGWELPAGIAGGALVGLGAFVLVREVLPATPALGPSLARLRPAGRSASPTLAAAGRADDGPLAIVTRWVRVPKQELALLDRTPEQYAVSLLVSGLIGLVLPVVAGFVLSLVGLRLGFAIPTVASLACAAAFIVLARHDVIAKADSARREYVRAIHTYLNLVALQLSAARGPVEALEHAADICQGPVFDRIREALVNARDMMRHPWQELRELSDRIGVPELGDVGAIMQGGGGAGAPVQDSLRKRADSLRDQIRTDDLARAESVNSRLDIPGPALIFVLVAAVLYPLMSRV